MQLFDTEIVMKYGIVSQNHLNLAKDGLFILRQPQASLHGLVSFSEESLSIAKISELRQKLTRQATDQSDLSQRNRRHGSQLNLNIGRGLLKKKKDIEFNKNNNNNNNINQKTLSPISGILHPADASIAAALGVKGVIVSNHGARQVDTSPATIQVLESVVNAFRDTGTPSVTKLKGLGYVLLQVDSSIVTVGFME